VIGSREKYLEIIQGIVARMGGNQFTLRTWSVGLGTAIMGYAAANDNNPKAALLAVIPAAIFWILDGYYLGLERKFRELYNLVKGDTKAEPNYTLDITGPSLQDWSHACRRPAVWLVHAPIMLLATIIGIIAWLK
jgi:hypothetical protein